MNSKAMDIIYAIICPNCESFYIGQTENLRKRVTLGNEQVRHQEYGHVKVSNYQKNCNNGHFKNIPIHQCNNLNSLFREMKEKELISQLKLDLNLN